jgi:hypothetical protein
VNSKDRRSSRRFIPTNLMERLVPLVLGILLLALLVTLAVILLSALGLTPGA